MNDSENICLACGICCDGTLIGFVQLEREEFAAQRDVLDIEESDEIGFFLQPCKKFCNACTIYEKRPKQCAKFECQLLQSVDNKELAFDAAVEIVKEVKDKKQVVEGNITDAEIKLVSPSFYFRMVELNKLLLKNKSDNPLIESQTELRENLEDLNTVIAKNFGVSYF